MRARTITIAVSLLLFVTTVVAATIYYASESKAAQYAKVEVVQLPVQNDVIPVELKQVEASLAGASELANLSFIVKNNTSKDIAAFSVALSLVLEKGDSTSLDQNFITSDTLVHPDIREIHHLQPFSPGQEKKLDASPISFLGGSMIKSIRLNLDYVEFENKSTLGPNKNGARIITLQREGAFRYKNWLVSRYMQDAKSVESVVALLQAKQIPDDIQGGGMHLKQGANIYRKHLLDGYDLHGAKDLEKYLNR